MSNNEAIVKVSNAIESALKECGVQAISKLPAFIQAVQMARGISALRAALTDDFVQQTIMPLQGIPLGFLTDQDQKGGYGLAVVRECSIEAMLRGLRVVGNEFNIISGRCYGAKAGYERLVQEFPGLTNLELQPGVPQNVGDKGALVPYVASWRLNGKEMALRCAQEKDGTDLRIPVKVNSGMGSDAVIGKATRKILHRIYSRINGGSFGATDGEVGEETFTTTGEPAPSVVPEGGKEGRRFSLNGKKGPVSEPTPKQEQPANAEDDGRIS